MISEFHGRFTQYTARLLLARGVMLVAFSLLIGYALLLLKAHALNQPVLAVLFLLYLAGSIPPLWSVYRQQRTSARQLFQQLLLDISLLSALLYFTGGYTNPLISFYLFPVLMAGIALSRHHAWLVGGLAILAYTLLMHYYQPLLPMMQPSLHDGFQLHLLGMWLTFVLSVLLLVGVVVRISEQRREHEQQLADWQQRSIRGRSMVALGAQAASDSHELSTPINSLMLLLTELERPRTDHAPDQEAAATMQVMQQQLNRCRQVLARLGKRAVELSSTEPEVVPLTQLVEQSVAKWRNLFPDIRVEIKTEARGAPPQIIADPMLEQTLFVLFDNSVDAGASCIHLRVAWDATQAAMTVWDNGSGFIESLLKSVGDEPLTTKAHGKGLGLYLAHFVMDQMRGSVAISNRTEGGACVQLRFPVVAKQGQLAKAAHS
ncbi:MAG: HAMP domain-containing sensor histidine kinase [Mariprofundales bacterium]|nr:HAMP domain-containing sensor histidine kinase [Mariprofundales bacterium]